MAKKAKPNSSHRIDPDLLKKVKDLGMDHIEIIEAALAVAIEEKKCPYCGATHNPHFKDLKLEL